MFFSSSPLSQGYYAKNGYNGKKGCRSFGNDITCCKKSPDFTVTSPRAECLHGQAGFCIDVDAEQCVGAVQAGYCPGPDSIKCCPSGKVVDTSDDKADDDGGGGDDDDAADLNLGATTTIAATIDEDGDNEVHSFDDDDDSNDTFDDDWGGDATTAAGAIAEEADDLFFDDDDGGDIGSVVTTTRHSATTTRTALTTTATTTTTTTSLTTTTVFDPANADCVEEEDACSLACQKANERNYTVVVPPIKRGKACVGATDCLPGVGGCPSTPAVIVTTGFPAPATTTTPSMAAPPTTTVATMVYATVSGTPNATHKTEGIDDGIRGGEKVVVRAPDADTTDTPDVTRGRMNGTDMPPCGAASVGGCVRAASRSSGGGVTRVGRGTHAAVVVGVLVVLGLVAAAAVYFYQKGATPNVTNAANLEEQIELETCNNHAHQQQDANAQYLVPVDLNPMYKSAETIHYQAASASTSDSSVVYAIPMEITHADRGAATGAGTSVRKDEKGYAVPVSSSQASAMHLPGGVKLDGDGYVYGSAARTASQPSSRAPVLHDSDGYVYDSTLQANTNRDSGHLRANISSNVGPDSEA